MSSVVKQHWEPTLGLGVTKRDRRGGLFGAYVPDFLSDRPVLVTPDLAIQTAKAERLVQSLTKATGAADLAGISQLLLRSEAIASSLIEGITPSPQQVALAELADDEPIRGVSQNARLVANNITVLRRATRDLADAEQLTVSDLVDLHRALLPDERHPGLRGVQNWIGGSEWHPLDAVFVPAPPDRVPDLMADLVVYLNGSSHAPLIQAALVHAQFETIHPFTDGNGRVGRALIHTVLARRGLASDAVLPISVVLATLSHSYIDGLGAYRYQGDQSSEAAIQGVQEWVRIFVDAAVTAALQARRISDDIAGIRLDWISRLEQRRRSHGVRLAPRAGSAVSRVLAMLPEVPVMTSRTIQRLLKTSFPSARAALEELADAGILVRKNVEQNTTGYLARDILDLIAHTERRLASTHFDTRLAPPNRPAPASPRILG